MRTPVIDGVILAVDEKNRHRCAPYIHDSVPARRDVSYKADPNPIRHVRLPKNAPEKVGSGGYKVNRPTPRALTRRVL